MSPKKTPFNLSTDTILMRLVISTAGLRQRSRTLSREAAETHSADVDSLHGIVDKLPSEAMKPITQIISKARTAFYFGTLRWDDNAYRLVPLTRYADLKKSMDECRSEFIDAVEDLVSAHKKWERDYHRRVNDLAEELPFPTQRQLRENFGFEVREMTLADPDDIRLHHVDPKAVDEIRESIATTYRERMADAQAEVIERVREVVERLKNALTKTDGRLFATTIGSNLDKLVETLPALNIGNDPEIARIIKRVAEELGGLDIDHLKAPKPTKTKTLSKAEKAVRRTVIAERKATAQVASSILDDLKNFGVK